MSRTSRDKSNFLKHDQEFSRSYSQLQSADTDFSFLSTPAGNNYSPACTPSMEEVGSLNSWEMLLLFGERTTTLSKYRSTAIQPLQRHARPSSLPIPKVLRPPLQVASTAPYSFLPSSLPPLLLPLGLKNGYHVFKNQTKLDQVCKQFFLLHSF